MSNLSPFIQTSHHVLPLLIQYVPVVDRVHGAHHPEFHDVRAVFNALARKIKETPNQKPNLDAEFKQLSLLTSNYSVPGDVCETYEAVYQMLKALHDAYLV